MPGLAVSVSADGLGAGVTTVATFLPPIFMIFLCLSLLEESGYMARAAFIMDRFLAKIGLPGKAFIPLLAVCRQINKIAFESPEDIVEQLVDLWIGTVEIANHRKV